MSGASVDEKVSRESRVESQTAPSLHKEDVNASEDTKLDKHGLPLIPQPSNDPSDPLNFPQWLKIAILLQVSFLAGLGPLNQAVINPAYVPLSLHFHKTTVVASYQTTIAIAFAGVGSFLWVPLANTYGRRPVLLFTTLIAAASSLASGKSQTWSQLIGTRVLNGIGTSSFFTIGAGMVTDTFFLHERGRAMGVFTVFLTNSAHVAPIPGGFLGQYVGWQWCYYLPAILDMALFVMMFFCLPETLYMRGSKPVETNKPLLRRLKLWGHRPEEKHLKLSDFWRPFQMVIYPSVLISAFYYCVTFSFSSILPAVTSATLFRLHYHFTPSKTGLALGLGTLIGSTLGELLGGIVVDRSMRLSRKNNTGGTPIPEVRLHGIWAGAILQPIGMLIWGFCWQYNTHWIGPTMGFTIMCFAIQIISTVLYSYTADCYKPQTPEIAQVFNFARQVFGMTLGFWSIPMGQKIGFQFMGLTLALVGIVTFMPVVFLMYKGQAIREKLGTPTFNSRL
ncbi:MFS general substrate transporter [Mycena indigotica]|uniref:MFS general substrate transporter n=1 Tax=Mycena indigotica TaxID=2126181 RepID=A0A8H6SDZ1_9AGAR|nr:MFS general substrate transporter [Mycena indigotica]KAF7297188.1 MFS general substrate transporter [Mycena indigotica]